MRKERVRPGQFRRLRNNRKRVQVRVEIYFGVGNIYGRVDLDRRLRPRVAAQFHNLTGKKTLRQIGAITDDWPGGLKFQIWPGPPNTWRRVSWRFHNPLPVRQRSFINSTTAFNAMPAIKTV
jgi:hypothetical protein